MSIPTITALNKIDELVDLVDYLSETLDERALDKAQGFLESVRKGLVGVSETIERTGEVTPKQTKAIDNWSRGLNAWRHDD